MTTAGNRHDVAGTHTTTEGLALPTLVGSETYLVDAAMQISLQVEATEGRTPARRIGTDVSGTQVVASL